jgi:hypothetical protein
MDSEEVVPQVFCRIEKVTNTPSNIEYSIILININLINNLVVCFMHICETEIYMNFFFLLSAVKMCF